MESQQKRLKTSSLPSSSLLERLGAFLPQIAKANDELEENGVGDGKIDGELVSVADPTNVDEVTSIVTATVVSSV